MRLRRRFSSRYPPPEQARIRKRADGNGRGGSFSRIRSCHKRFRDVARQDAAGRSSQNAKQERFSPSSRRKELEMNGQCASLSPTTPIESP